MSDEEQKPFEESVIPERPWEGTERRSSATLDVMAVRMETMHNDVNDMKSVLRDLTRAISKLALVEDRQGQDRQSIERVFDDIKAINIRIAALEVQNPSNRRVTQLIDTLLIGAVGILIVFILGHVGLPLP